MDLNISSQSQLLSPQDGVKMNQVCSLSVGKRDQHQPLTKQPQVEWDDALCDCFEDMSTCCYGFWCCPCLACTVSERLGENRLLPLCDICSPALTIYGLALFVSPAVLSLRVSMRNRYGIKGSVCKDIAAACCCCWCAWCQMHRELKHRKKTPTVINIQNQSVVQVQPSAERLAPGYPLQPSFVSQQQAVMKTY